jgi:4-amino-4-deoxy-L-arabinose transferase-like glycosyltransferase
MLQLYRHRPLLVLSIIFANIALSAWCIYLDPVINFDGVTYTSVAQLFLQGKLTAAFDYYSWPFYSLFIAFTAKLFFVDVETAAFILNTLFAISLTLAFVCIVAELSDNNQRIILLATVMILMFPSISKYRSFIIRDFGYLSCYLWSLYFLFKFCVQPNKKYLIAWLVFAGLSSLFRFEGIIFVLIAPYFLFLFGSNAIPHRKKVLAMLSVVLAVSSVTIVFWYINDKYTDSIAANQDIGSLTDFFIANIQNGLGDRQLTFFSLLDLISSNTKQVAYELIRRMAIFYFIFAAYAYFKRLTLKEELTRKIWLIFLFTNLVMLIGFSLSNNFIVSRYAMATALTLLILAPFALDQLITFFTNSSIAGKLSAGLVMLLLTLVSLEGLDVKSKKSYIKEGGIWIKNNLPEGASIYSNNKLAIYYSDRGAEANLDNLYSLDILQLFIRTNEIRTFDFVAMVSNTKIFKEDTTRQTLGFHFGKPLKIIQGEGDDSLFIFSTTYQEW